MDEYIKRDEAIRKAIDACIKVVGHGITQFDAVDIAEIIESIPAADVVETKRGEMKIGNEHLFAILKEALRHPAIGVYLKEDGKINLFFDGCCECDIEVQDYTDLRCDYLTEKGGSSDA